jgi:hypothetical protein
MITGPSTGIEITGRGVRTKQINPVLRSASSHCDIVPTLYFGDNTKIDPI